MSKNGGKQESFIATTLPSWLVAALLVLITFFLNRTAFDILPVEDSLALVQANLNDFTSSLTAGWGFAGNLWRPFLVLSFALDHLLFKDSYSYFYLQQFLLYGLSAFFIYRLSLKTSHSEAFAILAALIFLLLPVHHENIYWLAGRGHLLSLCLMLCSVDLLSADNTKHEKILRFFGHIFAVLSMLTYETGFLQPVILFTILLINEQNITKTNIAQNLKNCLVPFLLSLSLLVIRWFVLGGIGGFADTTETYETIPLFTGFLEHIVVDPYSNPITSVFFHTILAISLLYFVIKSLKTKSINRLFCYIIVWQIFLLPFLSTKGFAPRFALSASISTALALSCILLFLYRQRKLPLIFKTLALALLITLVYVSFAERKQAIADWTESGRMINAFKQEYDRVEKHFTKPGQLIAGLPERTGKAYTAINYLPYMMRATEKNLRVRHQAVKDNAFLEQLLLDRLQDSQYWIFIYNSQKSKGELRQLIKEPTKPEDLRFVFKNCVGTITFDEFEIQKKGLKGQYNFTNWQIEGKAVLQGSSTLDISSDPLILKSPLSGGPILDNVQSLTLKVQTDIPACKLEIAVDDKKGVGEYAERKFTLDFAQRKNWRISGYDPSIALWFNHIAAIQYQPDIKTDTEIPQDIKGKTKFVSAMQFDDAEYIEKLSFKARAVVPALNALVNAKVYFLGEKKNDLASKHIAMNKPQDYELYSTGIMEPFKVEKLIVGSSTNAKEFSATDFEIYRPVSLPEIKMNNL